MTTTRLNCLAQRVQRDRLLEGYLSARSLTAEAISHILDLDRDDVAYVTGSVVDGVGDSQSDLDIYVLTSREGFARRSGEFDNERRTQQQRQEFGIIYCDVAGHRFDAECHPLDKFVELLRELAGLEPLDRDCLWRNFRCLGRFERVEAIELLHRFRVGVPIHNGDRYGDLFRLFDEWRFFAWNVHFHLIEAEDYVKGVRRSLKENDEESAYLKLLRLYDSLADAKLFLSGDSLDRWKWRLVKLRKLGDRDFLDLYLDVQLGRNGGGKLHHRVGSLLEQACDLHGQFREQLGVGR